MLNFQIPNFPISRSKPRGPRVLRLELVEPVDRGDFAFAPVGVPPKFLRGNPRARGDDFFAGVARGAELGPADDHVGQRARHLVANRDRKSTRLNSSHVRISYAVF